MKKRIRKMAGLMLCGVISVMLIACGKSESVKQVEKQISDIGNVTMESYSKITEAEDAYNELPDNEKKKVKNYKKLLKARKKMDALGVVLSVDNYADYLDVTLGQRLTNPIDMSRAMGVNIDSGTYVYRGIEILATVKGKTEQYQYNDVKVKILYGGWYIPFSAESIKQMNRDRISTEDYAIKNITPLEISIDVNVDASGTGEVEKIIDIPDDNWVMGVDAGMKMDYAVSEVSGTLTPIKKEN